MPATDGVCLRATMATQAPKECPSTRDCSMPSFRTASCMTSACSQADQLLPGDRELRPKPGRSNASTRLLFAASSKMPLDLKSSAMDPFPCSRSSGMPVPASIKCRCRLPISMTRPHGRPASARLARTALYPARAASAAMSNPVASFGPSLSSAMLVPARNCCAHCRLAPTSAAAACSARQTQCCIARLKRVGNQVLCGCGTQQWQPVQRRPLSGSRL